MKKKGQGTFEYVLLLAGVLLIVILAIVLLRQGPLGGAQQNIERNACKQGLSLASQCYNPDRTWNTGGSVPAGQIPDCTGITGAVQRACDANSATGDWAPGTLNWCCGAQP